MKKTIVCLMALFIMGCSSSDSEYTLTTAETELFTNLNKTEVSY